MTTASPRRTCIGCRQVKPKADLVRLVRGDDGRVKLDPEAVAAGRGVYACRSDDCLTRALASARLSHAFRGASQPPAQSAAAIMEHLSSLDNRRRR